MSLCVMPGCQTTAGCICDRVSRRPIYHCGTPERQVVYAWAGEVDELRAALRLIAFANFEPIDGTRSGTVMLTIEEMRHIRKLVGATPAVAITAGDRDG